MEENYSILVTRFKNLAYEVIILSLLSNEVNTKMNVICVASNILLKFLSPAPDLSRNLYLCA